MEREMKSSFLILELEDKFKDFGEEEEGKRLHEL